MLFQRIKKGDGSKSRERARERERDVISQVIAFRCHAWLRAVKRKITSGIAEQKTSWGGMWKLANYTTRKHVHTTRQTNTKRNQRNQMSEEKKRKKHYLEKQQIQEQMCREGVCIISVRFAKQYKYSWHSGICCQWLS